MAWISPRPTLRVPMVGKDLDGSPGETAARTKTAKRRCNGLTDMCVRCAHAHAAEAHAVGLAPERRGFGMTCEWEKRI
jgi:hypothetical protein